MLAAMNAVKIEAKEKEIDENQQQEEAMALKEEPAPVRQEAPVVQEPPAPERPAAPVKVKTTVNTRANAKAEKYYKKALESFVWHDYAAAKKLFIKANKTSPGYKNTQYYLDRIKELE